jgi:RNA polymerase sigma-70 factor (ECF subfamily)
VTAVSFDALYEETFEFVYRNARRLGVNEAAIDDVVQEVFMIVHRRLGEFDPASGSPRAWVYGILANTVRGYRRTFRRKLAPLRATETEDELGPASSRSSPEQRATRRQDTELLLGMLAELPAEQRELIVLGELEQLSVPEICACIGGNPNTVYSRLRAAREALRKKVAQHLLERKVPA